MEEKIKKLEENYFRRKGKKWWKTKKKFQKNKNWRKKQI